MRVGRSNDVHMQLMRKADVGDEAPKTRDQGLVFKTRDGTANKFLFHGGAGLNGPPLRDTVNIACNCTHERDRIKVAPPAGASRTCWLLRIEAAQLSGNASRKKS